jgi:hypothetical protein
VRELECHPVDGHLPLAVIVEIVQKGKRDQNGQKGVEGGIEEVVDPGPAELALVEPLEVKDAEMDGQE